MIDFSRFSKSLLNHPEAKSKNALERIALGKKRVLNILDRETVAHQRTLEQKISDQGPNRQRVDPHLVGLALMDLQELNRIQPLKHQNSNTKSWYALRSTPEQTIKRRLDELGPLYQSVSGGGFGNLTGDALEVVVFRCLDRVYRQNRLFAFQGCFSLVQPKTAGRYIRIKTPQTIGSHSTKKEPDFIQFGYDPGPLCIECKNYREWLYPRQTLIKELIKTACELDALPVLIHRRIHYSAMTNLLYPAGIIAHESYHQYYPSDQAALAEKVRDKRSLGFTDVRATEDPHPRTIKFFENDLPKIVPHMATKWLKNKSALYDFANGQINLPQLYTAINSPVGGKWREIEADEPAD